MSQKYDVWVVKYMSLEGDKVSGTLTEDEYVSATSADMGEVVAACQVLFPDAIGVMILPWSKTDK